MYATLTHFNTLPKTQNACFIIQILTINLRNNSQPMRKVVLNLLITKMHISICTRTVFQASCSVHVIVQAPISVGNLDFDLAQLTYPKRFDC